MYILVHLVKFLLHYLTPKISWCVFYILDGQDCRQEKGYDDMKGPSRGSSFGDDICHEYSDCIFDKQSEMFRCKCKEGYDGDGHECQIQKGIVVK